MNQQQQQQQVKQEQLQPVSPRLDSFLKYINFKLIAKDELNLAMDYIDNNLNAASSNSCGYWYDMYSYCIKNFVLRHKEKNNEFPLLTILGECVCQDKVTNFLKNTDKKCFCNKGCSSVYYNKVF